MTIPSVEFNDDDLASHEFGCQLLAKKQFEKVPTAALFWHLTRFPGRVAAEAVAEPADIVVDAEHKTWLFRFGSRNAVPRAGKSVARVGPLVLVPAKTYEVVVYRLVMPPAH